MKLEGNSAPSSSSNHVVLQRLTSKTERRDEGELPRIGEEDIDNVIGSRRHFLLGCLYGCWLLQLVTWRGRGGRRGSSGWCRSPSTPPPSPAPTRATSPPTAPTPTPPDPPTPPQQVLCNRQAAQNCRINYHIFQMHVHEI